MCLTDYVKITEDDLILYLTLPAGWMTAINRHPTLRPQRGPNAQPRQTSRSEEPLRSFGEL